MKNRLLSACLLMGLSGNVSNRSLVWSYPCFRGGRWRDKG